MDKILFVTTVEFRPPFNGGTVYSHGIFAGMSLLYEVDVVVLKSRRRFQNAVIHTISSGLRAIFSAIPLNVIFHSRGIHPIVEHLDDYKFIIVDHIESLAAISKTKKPYVLIAHNLEYTLAGDKIRNRLVRSFFQFTEKLRRYEYQGFKNSAGVICISASEAIEIARHSDKVVQVLPAFPARTVVKTKSDKLRIGFLGAATWSPNARTVDKIIHDILPKLDRNHEFVLAGSGWDIGPEFPENTRKLGFVDDVAEFLENIDVVLAPTEQGAGVNIKICEALHFGIPVITNSQSAKAIYGENTMPNGLIVADTQAQTLKALAKLDISNGPEASDDFSIPALTKKLKNFMGSLDD